MLKAEYTFNASKIVDIPGIEDSDNIISNVDVGNVCLKAKASSGDRMNLIDAYGDISVNSVVIRAGNTDFITDGYILNHNSDCSYSDFNLIYGGRRIQENKQTNIVFDLSADMKEIKELSIQLSNATVRNGKIVSKANANVLCVNQSGDLCSINAGSNIEIPIGDYENAVVSLGINSFDYNFNQNGKLDVRLNLNLDAYVYNEKSTKVLSDINADDEVIEYPSLTVYFGRENEAVWGIAKSFSSDIDLIKKENNLSSDILDSNKVLIIPKA